MEGLGAVLLFFLAAIGIVAIIGGFWFWFALKSEARR